MTEIQKRDCKKRLQKKCIEIIEERITTIRMAMNDAQASANNEEKSSAGDKYETSRAMSHLQKDMQATRLSSIMKELEALLLVNCNKICHSAETGSFVNCGALSFFISAGLGKVIFENDIIFFVSPVAPIAKILHSKKTGDEFIFNKETLIIKYVY